MMQADDNGPTIVGVTWFLCFVSCAFLFGRIYAKISRSHEIKWDDWILILSWALLFIMSVLTQTVRHLGLGKHIWDISPTNLPVIASIMSIVASLSLLAAAISKISIGITLLRLTRGRWRRLTWIAVATLLPVTIPSILTLWLQCTPAEKSWNPTVEGHCWDPLITNSYHIFSASWCCLITFTWAFLPWKMVWSLRLETQEKIGIAIAVSMGVLSGICGLSKTYFIFQIRKDDFLYDGKAIFIWTSAEIASAIIGASVPVLRILFMDKVLSCRHNASLEDIQLPVIRDGDETLKNKSIESTIRSSCDARLATTTKSVDAMSRHNWRETRQTVIDHLRIKEKIKDEVRQETV